MINCIPIVAWGSNWVTASKEDPKDVSSPSLTLRCVSSSSSSKYGSKNLTRKLYKNTKQTTLLRRFLAWNIINNKTLVSNCISLFIRVLGGPGIFVDQLGVNRIYQWVSSYIIVKPRLEKETWVQNFMKYSIQYYYSYCEQNNVII